MLEKKFETADLALAAFLLMKDFKLLRAKNIAGKYSFIFTDKEELAESACIEFINSDCSVFDNYLRSLRNMLRDTKK